MAAELCIPLNPSHFIVNISKQLALSEPQLTADFLNEFFVGWESFPYGQRPLSLTYMAPWLPGLRTSLIPTDSDGDKARKLQPYSENSSMSRSRTWPWVPPLSSVSGLRSVEMRFTQTFSWRKLSKLLWALVSMTNEPRSLDPSLLLLAPLPFAASCSPASGNPSIGLHYGLRGNCQRTQFGQKFAYCFVCAFQTRLTAAFNLSCTCQSSSILSLCWPTLAR
jgi:hypothetical protein